MVNAWKAAIVKGKKWRDILHQHEPFIPRIGAPPEGKK
jgi:hypothetical protein